MSLRRKLYLGIVLAVVLLALIETALDRFYDGLRARLAAQAEAGSALQAADAPSLLERVLGNSLMLGLIELPLFLALALGIGWLFTRLVMRPVTELTGALEQVSKQQFPEPVAVPPGDDELSGLARSFNTMSASIQGLLDRERSFTRFASHELRTPLSAVKVHVESLQLGLSSIEEAGPVLDRNIERMEGTLTSLLALARSSEQDAATPAAVIALLHEAVEPLPATTRRRVTVLDLQERQRLLADGPLVRQAVQNLVENALKYSSGQVVVAAEESRDEPGMVIVRVSDEGSGIAEDALDSVVKPFVRGDARRSGLGLGLALAENVARSMRGSLELRNTERGLDAVLRLPAAEPAAASSTDET